MEIPEISVRSLWWYLIRIGQKTVEGRKRSILRKLLGLDESVNPRDIDATTLVGTEISIRSDSDHPSSIFRVKIIAIRYYNTLREYLEAEGWAKVLPHPTINSIEDAIAEYHKYFSDDDIAAAGGMVALEIR